MAGYIDIFKKKKTQNQARNMISECTYSTCGLLFCCPKETFLHTPWGYFCNPTLKVTPPTCYLIKFLRTSWDTFAIPHQKLLPPLTAL